MPVFDYTGRNRRGEAVRGRLDGATPNIVADQLFSNGVTPIDIIPVRDGGDVLAGLRALRLKLNATSIALTDQIFFCRQMYTLLKAGVPILQALTIVKEKSPTSFVVEQTLQTPPRSKTLTFDGKTGHVLLITAEFAPPPPTPAGSRPARGQMVPDSFSILVVGK